MLFGFCGGVFGGSTKQTAKVCVAGFSRGAAKVCCGNATRPTVFRLVSCLCRCGFCGAVWCRVVRFGLGRVARSVLSVSVSAGSPRSGAAISFLASRVLCGATG